MRILTNAIGVGAATMASRILGFVRDALVAATLGSGPVADAFVVALRLPNLFRRLFAEGAFAAAFVPGFIALRAAEGAVAARRFAFVAGALVIAAVVVLTVVVTLWTEPVVALLAPGYADDPGKLALTADLSRIAFPYLLGVTVVAILAGTLAADRRFMAAAFAPVLFNLALIGALVALLLAHAPAGPWAGRVLAFAVAISGVLQAGLLIGVAARAGALPLPAKPVLGPALRRFGRALGPGLVAGGFVEINVVIGTMIASTEAGAVAWLYYADRLHQLPLGVVGIAIGQVLLPEIAEACARGPRDADDVQNRALEFATAIALPAAVGLAFLALPIVATLFQRGAFGATDAAETARALAAFALGLPAFVVVRVFAAAHFGRGDTKTPMLHGIAAVIVNVGLALALLPVLGWIAVAWATTAAAWVKAGLLGTALVRRDRWRIDADLGRRLPRILAAATAMGVVVVGLRLLVLDPLADAGFAVRVAALAGVIGAGLGVHVGLVLALGVVDPKVLRRRARSASPPGDEAACGGAEDRA